MNKNIDKNTKPWGTGLGTLISSLILVSIVTGLIAVTMLYGLYKKSVLACDKVTIISASTDIEGDTATSSLRIKIDKKGHRLASYDSRIEGNCMYITFYTSINGKYEPDEGGVTTLNLKTSRDINYIRMENGKQKKDLLLITWGEVVKADDVVFVEGKLTDTSFELGLRLSNRDRHICSYDGTTSGDKYVILVESSNVIGDYAPEEGVYTLSLPVKAEHKSIWVSDGKNERKLCDISWPEHAYKEDVSISEPEIYMSNTTADVFFTVKMNGDGYLWSYDESRENGVCTLTLYKNSVSGELEAKDGAYEIKLNIGNAINEIVVNYADSTESLCKLEWPTVVKTSELTINAPVSDSEGNLSFRLKLADESLYLFGNDTYIEEGKLCIRVYSSKYETEHKKDEEGFYTVSVKPNANIDFVVLVDGEAEQLLHATGVERLLDTDELSIEGYSLDGNALTVNFKINKEGYFLASYNSTADSSRTMLSLYVSSVEGDFKADSDGTYTLILAVEDAQTSLVQEGYGDEKTVIENFRA